MTIKNAILRLFLQYCKITAINYIIMQFLADYAMTTAWHLSSTYFFRLFPIISISQKIFSIFFLTLEKIGIDKKVICYHNISNLLWKKDVLCVRNKSESQKHYKFLALRPRICKFFSRFTFFSSH